MVADMAASFDCGQSTISAIRRRNSRRESVGRRRRDVDVAIALPAIGSALRAGKIEWVEFIVIIFIFILSVLVVGGRRRLRRSLDRAAPLALALSVGTGASTPTPSAHQRRLR